MKKYSLGLYEKAMPKELAWKDKLLTAKKAGYDFVEISIDETEEKLARLEWSRAERSEFLAVMREVGIPIRTMCLSGHRKYPLGSRDPAICARGMEIMEKAVRLADDLGIRIIQLAGYDVYYEQSSPETVARFASNLKKAEEIAAGAGVVLGFETMETEFMNTVKKAMNYVDIVNSPYLQVYPDAGNLTNAALTYGKCVLDDMNTGAGHLVAMHLKETVPGKFREIPYGTGHVDFQAMIKRAWALGVRKFVTEFWCVDDTWQSEMNTAVSMMTAILDTMD